MKYNDIPAEALEHTKALILTTIGVSLAATTTVPACRSMMELAVAFSGKRESTIWGYGSKVPCFLAAFVNGSLAHGLNFGDNVDEYRGHGGIAVLPAAFAVSERVGKVSGKEFLAACTVATDLFVRMASAVHWPHSRDWLAYGWMTGQLFGYFAATTVAARLMRLDEGQLIRAYGLAYAQAGGTTEQLFGAGIDKSLYAAYPGLAAVLAALMAQRGLAGPRHSLEGRAGLFNVYFQGQYRRECLVQDLGKRFAGTALGFYPYPGCSSAHAYTKAALDMVAEHNFGSEEIERVTVYIGPVERDLGLCEPLELRRQPSNISEAEMSIPFALAIALSKGRPRIRHYVGGGAADRAIAVTASKIFYEVDDQFGSAVGSPFVRPAIRIVLSDGRVLHSDKRVFRYGHPENPMSREAQLEKFEDCLSYSVKRMSRPAIRRLVEQMDSLEASDDVAEIVRVISLREPVSAVRPRTLTIRGDPHAATRAN